MTRHNITGSEAAPSWEAARGRSFAPAHGSIRMQPRRRLRFRPLLIFAAGMLAAFAAAAIVAAPR